MGKGSKRRPEQVKTSQADWERIFGTKPINRGRKAQYVWCGECHHLIDVTEPCGHSRNDTKHKRTYGFALMPDVPSDVARLLQHDQMDFQNTTIAESAEQMRRQHVERTATKP